LVLGAKWLTRDVLAAFVLMIGAIFVIVGLASSMFVCPGWGGVADCTRGNWFEWLTGETWTQVADQLRILLLPGAAMLVIGFLLFKYSVWKQSKTDTDSASA
jgi:hypothetical protein